MSEFPRYGNNFATIGTVRELQEVPASMELIQSYRHATVELEHAKKLAEYWEDKYRDLQLELRDVKEACDYYEQQCIELRGRVGYGE